MLKITKSIAAISVLLIFCFPLVNGSQISKANRQSQSDYLSSIPPQAVPVYQLLKATETSDVGLFKSVWYSGTLKMWDAWGVKDYRAYLKEYRKYWRKELGRYNLKDLQYRYEGDKSSGIIYIHSKKGRESLFVIIENGMWKVRGGD
jgi:hypothetical protein